MPRCENALVVVAFDFGTTYSGYAFSYVTDPTSVHINKSWIPGGAYSQLVTYKTPTSVLLDTKGIFHSFGYEAEDKFASLAEDNEHQGWRLFRHFKMILHKDKKLLLQSTVQDLEGRSHYAIEIFSMAISYLYRHAKAAVKLQRPSFLDTDFQYVITVPAIWDIRAKCFMREAAVMAGIDGNRLELAHEPEAAALWCCHDAMQDRLTNDLLATGSKYMVIDLGGGTADLSVHQVSTDGSIKVIHKADGGPWGGIVVDTQFLDYLKQRFGNEAVASMRENNIGDYFDMIREFEHKKRATAYHSANQLRFNIPQSLRIMARRVQKEALTFFQRLFNSKVNEPEPVVDKIRIESAQAEAWFETPVSCIIDHIKILMKFDKIKDIQTLLLVGGFGESQYVQDKIRAELAGLTLIVPREPGLAVLKGAVLFGHYPKKVESRVMTYTYGISLYAIFDEKKHPIGKRVLMNGEWRVGKCFEVFVKANEEITVDHEVSHTITPMASCSSINVYRTLSEKPEYTTDPGCELLGTLHIKNADNVPLKEQEGKVTFIFGNTELLVKVNNTATCEEEMLSLDCLQ